MTDQDAHPYTGSNWHPGSHLNIPASFQLPAGAPCILSLSVYLGFCLAAVAMFAISRLQQCLFALSCLWFVLVKEPQQKINKWMKKMQKCRVVCLSFRGSDWLGFEYGCLAEYDPSTGKHLYTHGPVTQTSASQLPQCCRGRGESNNRFICLLRPPKTWLRLHCRSFVEEDKRSAPTEIPESCNRNHVYDLLNIEKRKKNVQAILDYIIWRGKKETVTMSTWLKVGRL